MYNYYKLTKWKSKSAEKYRLTQNKVNILHILSIIAPLTLLYLIGKRKKIPSVNVCDNIGTGLEITVIVQGGNMAHTKR